MRITGMCPQTSYTFGNRRKPTEHLADVLLNFYGQILPARR